ncbi:MAG: hypothetical protein CV090_12170 [Nitrospira sp. WS238]|nr:hypothetical protein [Nitrospira sp. WS238]
MKRSSHGNWVHSLACALMIVVLGCSIVHERTNSPMTSVEQLLLTQAVERGLGDLNILLPAGTAVTLKSYGYTPDKEFARRLLEGWLRLPHRADGCRTCHSPNGHPCAWN